MSVNDSSSVSRKWRRKVAQFFLTSSDQVQSVVGKPIHVDAPVPKSTQAHVHRWGLICFRCCQISEAPLKLRIGIWRNADYQNDVLFPRLDF